MKTSQVFSYVNGSSVELQVIIEPWADRFLVLPDQRLEIVVRCQEGAGSIEFEQTANGLIIYGYEGCVMSVFSNGEELF
jgi:hypothetical protein